VVDSKKDRNKWGVCLENKRGGGVTLEARPHLQKRRVVVFGTREYGEKIGERPGLLAVGLSNISRTRSH